MQAISDMMAMLPVEMVKAFGFDKLASDLTGFVAGYYYGFLAVNLDAFLQTTAIAKGGDWVLPAIPFFAGITLIFGGAGIVVFKRKNLPI